MGQQEIESFLKHLAAERKLSLSTQNIAFNALFFLYKKVLKKKIKIKKTYRNNKPQLLPSVLTKEEVTTIISKFEGTYKLITQLLYGCGMRKNEVLKLRLNDIDIGNKIIYIKNAKGQKDRIAPIPESLIDTLRNHMLSVEKKYQKDIKQKYYGVVLPDSIANKNSNAAFELQWQYLFPAVNLIKDCRKRYHIHESTYDKTLKKIAIESGIQKRIHAHTFRHSFATHLLESGFNLRMIQELLGHKNIVTTMVYTHVTQTQIRNYESPLDTLNNRIKQPTILKIVA